MEVDTCRESLAPWCVGCGVDLGFGGSAITPSAICVDRAYLDPSRAFCATASPTHLVGDIRHLKWFADGVLDYVFSSHALEDFEDTAVVLREWARVLKPGGRVVLFLPDQEVYERDCRMLGSLPNQAHKHKDFGLEYMRRVVAEVPELVEEHSKWPVPYNPYSFELVLKRV
jgi:SAM-dependent methyltransferase